MRLNPDRDKAGLQFEALRHKLLQYFTYEGCGLPDRWADETLDRVAKRLSEGSLVEDISIYTRGVARMVLREARMSENRERNLNPPPAALPDEKERDARCLEECLGKLPGGGRELVEQYYLAPQSRILARKALAAQMGINMDALRSRALRVRRQLEICLTECREKHDGRGMNGNFSSDKNRR